MRDTLFSMPLGPMPGLKVEAPVAPAPVHPADKWLPVEGNSQVEVNGLGQMRTVAWVMPEPDSQDMAMMKADEARGEQLEMFIMGMLAARGAGLVCYVQDIEHRMRQAGITIADTTAISVGYVPEQPSTNCPHGSVTTIRG